MTVEDAREVADNPDEHDWLVVVHALKLLRRELDRVQAHTLEQARLRALAGTAYAPLGGWSAWGPA
jgi:hypothetical protein